jgi:hypothetical protein
MGTAIGLEWQMDQNIYNHTNGAAGNGPFTMSASVSTPGSTSLVIAGLTATSGTFNPGDVLTVAAVNAVNPQSRQSTNKLRKFVVVSGGPAAGSGIGTFVVAPAMYLATSANATIDAYPQSGAVVSLLGSASQVSPQNLVFHRDAFCLGMADLPLPRGVDMAGRVSDKQLGLGIRLVRAYDIQTDTFPCRLDVLYGWTVLYPQLAVRVCG